MIKISSLKIRKIILISILMLSILLLPLNESNNPAIAEASTNTTSSNDYSTTTSPLTVVKWAQGSNTSRQITLYYNSTSNTTTWDAAEMVLPETWQGYKLNVYVYELTENRTWVNNTGFQNTYDPWVNGTVDAGGPFSQNNIFALWVDDGHESGDDCILLGEDGRETVTAQGTFYYYDQGDMAYFEQDFTVPRGEVVWAGFILEYNASTDSTWEMTGMFKLSVYIGGTLVWDIHFDAIPAENTWYSTGIISFNASLINAAGTTIRVALEATEDVGYSPDIRPRLMVDNVRVFVAAKARPSDVNLNMNGLSVQNIDYGTGSVTETSTWTSSPVIANFTWTPSMGLGLDHDIYVTFKADLTLYIKKQDYTLYSMDLAAQGLNLAIYNGTDAEWSFYVWVHVPSYYGQYKFNLSIPLDWNVTFVAEPTTPTMNRIANCSGGNPEDGYIEVLVYLISDTPDGYWILKAKSPNYVYDVWTQIYNAATNQWENSTTFRPSNITRVVARILNSSGLPPADVTSYAANITIRFSNGTVWYTALVTPDANGYVISSNITIGGTNTTGDLYTVEVHWNSQVEAGDLQRRFSVIHQTSLSIWNPPDARTDLQAEAYYGDLVLLTVRFNDTDSGRLLTGAVVKCNWTTGELTLADKGTGDYEITLDTSELPGNGRYIIVITATMQYYDDANVTLTLDVYYRTVLSSPQAPEYGVPVPIGNNLTVDLYYERADTRTGITGATITANGTWNDRILDVKEVETGHYVVYFNTTGLTAGYQGIELTASKSFYETRSITIRFLFVYKTKYSPESLAIYVGYNENFTVWFKYELYNGSPVLDATVKVYVEWLDQWVIMTDPDNDGNYTAIVNASAPMATVYSLIFCANKTLHQSWEVSPVTVVIWERHTLLEVLYPANLSLTVTWLENATVKINYLDAVTQGGIANATVTVDWAGGSSVNSSLNNGTYIIEISTSEISVGIYMLTITFDTPTYTINSTLIQVVIKERETQLVAPTSLTVTWFENATIKVNYLDNETGTGITGASVDVIWIGSYSVDSSLNNGTYIIEISTSEIPIAGNYSLTMTFDASGYVGRSISIFIAVSRQESDVRPRSIEVVVVWGDLQNITINYINNRTGIGVPGATVNYNLTVLALTHIDLKNGSYVFVFDSSKVSTGIYTVLVVFDSTVVKPATCIIKIHVVDVSTDIVVLETDYSVPIGDLFNFIILYNDLNHSRGIDNALVVVDWPYGYDIETIGGGKYRISLVTETVPIGEYVISVSASRHNYKESSKLVTVRIRLIKTRIDIVSSPAVYFTQIGNITIQVWDVDHNVTIDYALIVSNLTRPPEIREKGNGIYTITFDTTFLDIGTYAVQINASRTNYETSTITVMVEILPIPTNYRLYIIGANITGQVISIIEGGAFNITVEYIDLLHNEKIEGATVYLIFPNGTVVVFYEVGGGNYTVKIDTHELETTTYNLTLVLSKEHYEEQQIQLYLRVEPKPVMPMKVLLMGLLTGSGVAAGIFALAASWYFYFRFPAFVRLTRSISKRLIRGKSPKFGKVREREEIIRDLIRRDYGTIVPPVFLEREEVEVEVPEVEEVSEELVEAGEETLREVTETIETLTGIEAPRELKRLLEEKEEEIEEIGEKVEKEEEEETERETEE